MTCYSLGSACFFTSGKMTKFDEIHQQRPNNPVSEKKEINSNKMILSRIIKELIFNDYHRREWL
jgi:hypothetical protein